MATDDLNKEDSAGDATALGQASVFEQSEMPAVWATIDEGETWVWGDYFLVLQEYPETIAVHEAREAGDPIPAQPKFFPNVMSVFYRYDKSLYSPSGKPVSLFMLECADMDARDKYMGAKSADQFLAALEKDGLRPDYRQVWSDGRDESKPYEGTFEQNTIRSFFFKDFKRLFKVKGVPRFQGSLKDALKGQEKDHPGGDYRPEPMDLGGGAEPKKGSSKWLYIALIVFIIIGFYLVTK
ncbi:MAG: hypothetical protein J5492_04390 [Oxalobacter sp.]|nr:hypothetical protein [Oxalobacter sp.]